MNDEFEALPRLGFGTSSSVLTLRINIHRTDLFMLVGLSALMRQREIHRTGSHGISYLGFLLQFAETFRFFLYLTKFSTLFEDLFNFVTFRYYGLITEKNCVLLCVQAEVEERDDVLKLTIVNCPLLLSAFTTYGRLQVFDYDRLQFCFYEEILYLVVKHVERRIQIARISSASLVLVN
jgi:hypothetical protein